MYIINRVLSNKSNYGNFWVAIFLSNSSWFSPSRLTMNDKLENSYWQFVAIFGKCFIWWKFLSFSFMHFLRNDAIVNLDNIFLESKWISCKILSEYFYFIRKYDIFAIFYCKWKIPQLQSNMFSMKLAHP